MTRSAAALAALTAGIAHTFGFAPTGWWPLQLATLAVLAGLVRGAGPRRAAVLGWIFGIGWFTSGVSWVYVSMHDYGAMPAPLAAAATLAFAAYLALFPAAASAAACRLRPESDGLHAIGFASAWALSELARGWLLTGFPWLAVGYAHTDSPLAGLAPLAGVYGVTWAAALVAALLATAVLQLRRSRSQTPVATVQHAGRKRVATVLATAAAALVTTALLDTIEWTRPAGPPVPVRLVQGNVPQDMKFDPARTQAAMQRYVDLIEAAPAPLTILPETAWTLPWRMTPPQLAARIDAYARRHRAAVAIGMPLETDAGRTERITNSVAVLGPPAGTPPSGRQLSDAAEIGTAGIGTVVGRYDKQHLVPFGEFVPWGFRWFVDLMHIPLGDFGRGSAQQPPVHIAGQQFAFNVCYEDLFGEELIGAVAQGATVLVNVSNIAWFGQSLALPQHLQIARMRAIETGRPMLRATNTGMTASIDARGRVLGRLDPMTEGVLTTDVTAHQGLTPFVRAGNAPVALLSAISLAALGLRRRRTVPAAA